MARNPELLRAIFANPREDTVRLVYADWLQENGDEAHAELIRVQCELERKPKPARRKVLVAREAELLKMPSFHLPGNRPLQYERGFIRERCVLHLTERGNWLDAHPMPILRAGFLQPQEIIITLGATMDTTIVSLLDRVINVNLNIGGLSAKPRKAASALQHAVTARVTCLECWEGAVADGAWASLLKTKHLQEATTILFDKAWEVPLDRIAALALSDVLPHLNHIHLDGESWTTAKGAEVGDDELAAFVSRIGADEKAAQLRSFQMNWPIGPRTADALLAAKYLKPAHLMLPLTKGLPKPAKAALKKRFGKALMV